MPEPTCIKCAHTVFELVESSPIGSDFKFLFLQCENCGGVAGVLDYLNIGSALIEQNKLLRKVAQALNVDADLDS